MKLAARAGTIAAAIFLIPFAGRADSFDKPLKKTVLDLGRSQYLMQNDKRPVTVTCWYYRHFMVKEKDDPGMKGAELIAMAPARTKCLQALQPGEKEFKKWSAESKAFHSWNGYFAGVKHDLVFLEWPDGDDMSGMPFFAFEPDAQTILFKDSVMLRAGGRRDLNFLPAPGNQITFRYLRVASAECSIPKSGKTCWSKLQQQTGLTHSPMPICTDYKGKEAGTAPSVIAYPVQVSFYPKPITRPLGGPVRCYPTE